MSRNGRNTCEEIPITPSVHSVSIRPGFRRTSAGRSDSSTARNDEPSERTWFGESTTRNHASTPVPTMTAPTSRKNADHCPAWVMGSRAPNTRSIDTSGITWRTPSTRPRLSTSVMSVTQALNAASLAPAPKKLMTASTTMMATTAAVTALANGTRRPTFSGLTRPNAIVDRPHRM